MRNKSALDPLISEPVQQILSALLLERREPWYLSDLAKRLGRTPSTLQRPLNALVSAGILCRWTDGNRVYFERDTNCPFLPELESLLAKTAGLVEILREMLRTIEEKIAVAFVYGSVARGAERSESDVDLILLGSLSLADLSPYLLKAEQRLGRAVNASVFQPEEFAAKVASRNQFLRSVLERDKIFLWGTADELEHIVSSGKSRSARHK